MSANADLSHKAARDQQGHAVSNPNDEGCGASYLNILDPGDKASQGRGILSEVKAIPPCQHEGTITTKHKTSGPTRGQVSPGVGVIRVGDRTT
jgi:hypothetical protein